MEIITAIQFWDLYFRNEFVRLERDSNWYKGVVYVNASSPGAPAGMFRKRPKKEVQVFRTELGSYDYSSDGRFALFFAGPKSIGAALEAVIAKEYPYRDPAPFGKDRMAELCVDLRARMKLTNDSEADLAIVHSDLSRMIEDYYVGFNQSIAALVWLLGELRQRSSAEFVLQVLQNSPYSRTGKIQLHFTAVNAAFSALWKINDKQSVWKALDLMRGSDTSGQQKVGALIERLFSTKELLSLDLLDEDYLSVDRWLTRLEPFRGWRTNDWDRYDASSLFWELRCLAASRLPVHATELREVLLRDEVATVRETARQRQGDSE